MEDKTVCWLLFCQKSLKSQVFNEIQEYWEPLAVVLKLRKDFLGGRGSQISYVFLQGGEGSQVASYITFFNLIFNKYKFYH